jgi:hypothetical protein
VTNTLLICCYFLKDGSSPSLWVQRGDRYDACPFNGFKTNSLVVEYTDPSGIFPDVETLLADHLPLRNLHWKSPSRPLRSIDSLQVNLVPGKDRRPTSDPAGTTTSQRRHQIPGLRQTPYLKIYLLRCDDNESYKTSSRKLVREWLKEHTSSSQSTNAINNQENHDAFEWLIVHVVYPDTAAASQSLSRSSSTASAAKASSEKVGSTKFLGRGSSTVFEKIKADFNSSSKSSPDRVAQIRLPRPSSQPQNRPAGVELREEDDAWTDLTEKLKALILASFDLRVSQYEEDIREKDSQRNLPGWNFCTFFILKEGLARGFENVGLLEDALIGYDELAIGLDVIVRDQAEDSENGTGGTFLSYSDSLRKDLLDKLNSEPDLKENATKRHLSLKLSNDELPLNVDQKPYRELILANNISIFDVRVYIFTRQLALLLKAANATSLRQPSHDTALEKPASNLEDELDGEDLLTLAETCRRATEFISIGSRSLRNDLECGFYKFHHPNDTTPKFLQSVPQTIDYMVKSWTFGVCLQVLQQTATLGLSIPASAFANGLSTNNEVVAPSNASNTDLVLPTRKSSLPLNAAQMKVPTTPEMFSPDIVSAPPGVHHVENSSECTGVGPKINRTGAEDLASWRAEVILMARHVLQGIAKDHKWHLDYTGLVTLYGETLMADDLVDVPLDDGSNRESEEDKESPVDTSSSIIGLSLPLLQQAVKLECDLKKIYEQLTDLALRHYLAANRSRSAERLFADMAVLKFIADDFTSAASYFHQVAPFYGGSHWTLLEGIMLELYARCLKQLDRKEDYVQVLLKLLPKYVTEVQRAFSSQGRTGSIGGHTGNVSHLINEYVDDLFRLSRDLPKEVSAPLHDFFGGLEIEPRVWQREESDGLQLRFRIRSLLDKDMVLQRVRVKLVEQADVSPREIWLESSERVLVKAVLSPVIVESNVSVQQSYQRSRSTNDSQVSVRGKYLVEKIEILSQNIHFSQDEISQALLPREFRDVAGFDTSNLDKPLIVFCYPCSNGVQVQVRPPSRIYLAESRSFEIEIQSGWNNIYRAVLNIRSGTAGLRIKLADAKIIDGKAEIQGVPQPGTIEFSDLEASTVAKFKIPYGLENDSSSLNFRLELTYSTDKGDFIYLMTTSIPSILPVSVNAQDMFRDTALFSRFTVVPATLVPLRVLDCHIDSSDTYEVIPAMTEATIMDIFPRQPASLLYKFVRRNSPKSATSPLALTMTFRCLDEEALWTIEDRFLRAIADSGFKQFSQLLVPRLLATFRTSMTATDLETIGLVREVETPSFEDVRWDSTLQGLRRSLQNNLKQWLKSWHQVCVSLGHAAGFHKLNISLHRRMRRYGFQRPERMTYALTDGSSYRSRFRKSK